MSEQAFSEETSLDAPEICLVVPLYNEEENVRELYQSMNDGLADFNRSWEVVFVDDGSSDSTCERLTEIAEEDSRVLVVQLRRNFGQTAALAAGFAHVRGSIIVTLDGDLQNDPRDIPLIIDKLEEGYDLVNGWRKNRKDPFIVRTLPSRIANWFISTVTGIPLHDYGCSLKAIRAEIVDELRLYGEMHRFIPAIAQNLGARIIEVPVRHHPRKKGESKYGITRTFRVVLDLLTVKFLSEYSTRPGHIFGLVGLLALSAGGLLTGFLGIQRLWMGVDLADRPILLLGILLIIVGIQFVTMGLIGEMLSRIYHESQQKPIYLIRKIIARDRTTDKQKVSASLKQSSPLQEGTRARA